MSFIDKEQSDESLMALVRSDKNHQAFSELVQRRHEMFYAAAYRIVGNSEDAEDVTQAAFLKIWDNPSLWKEGKKAKFTTWFYTIVTNMARDVLRKRKKVQDISNVPLSFDASQEGEMILTQQQQQLEMAIAALPEKQMLALNLCVYEELSNKEAAEIIGVGVKALESLLMRAKDNLRKQIKIKEAA